MNARERPTALGIRLHYPHPTETDEGYSVGGALCISMGGDKTDECERRPTRGRLAYRLGEANPSLSWEPAINCAGRSKMQRPRAISRAPGRGSMRRCGTIRACPSPASPMPRVRLVGRPPRRLCHAMPRVRLAGGPPRQLCHTVPGVRWLGRRPSHHLPHALRPMRVSVPLLLLLLC